MFWLYLKSWLRRVTHKRRCQIVVVGVAVRHTSQETALMERNSYACHCFVLRFNLMFDQGKIYVIDILFAITLV